MEVACGEAWSGLGTVLSSVENYELIDLIMACFGVTCGAKFNILITIKTVTFYNVNCSVQ